MIALPLWVSAVVNFAVRWVTTWQAQLRSEQALRDLGARSQELDSLRRAEAEESAGRAAGEAARLAPDDPRDLRD